MAFSIRNSRLVSVGLASVLAVGVIGAGSVALAQDSGASPEQRVPREHKPLKSGFGALLKDSGVTREEVKDGAQAGLTLAEIIDQYGDISSAEAKANALASLSERLDLAVAEGNISQERADELQANAPAMLDRLLAAVPGELGDHPRPGKVLRIAKHSLETIADVLGTDVAAIREALANGQTIEDLAGAQSQAVIDALTADANAAIDQAVVNGRIPEDRADDAKARAAEAIERFVSQTHPHADGVRKPMRPNAE